MARENDQLRVITLEGGDPVRKTIPLHRQGTLLQYNDLQ